MRLPTGLLALATLATGALAEDFQCKNSGGCPATRTEDGELVHYDFRKGDIVNDDAGWVVHPDDGWEKVYSNRFMRPWDNKPPAPPTGPSIPAPPPPPPVIPLVEVRRTFWFDPDGPQGPAQPILVVVLGRAAVARREALQALQSPPG